MAYINRNSGNSRNTTLVVVAVLHLGAAWGLVNGLGADFIKERVLNLPTTNYEDDAPPPRPVPPSPKEKQTDTLRDAVTTARPLVVPNTAPVFTLPPIEPVDPVEIDFPIAPKPAPSVEPGPRFDPVAAMPRGKPGNWVTSNDYPTRDIREGNEGMALFRLGIGADGRATSCEITRSSGHQGLDSATCALLRERARFDPARDGSGQRVSGSYSGRITWVIPR
jgi:protein TonB